MEILVIDDEKNMLDFLEIMLTKEGYRIKTAPSGKEGIELFRNEIFDLVITDMRMPDVGGLDVIREVKNISQETPVIVITAFASMESAVEALKLGAYDYITKPFKNEEIKLTVAKAIQKKKLEDENVYLKSEFKKRLGFENIIGSNKKMKEIFEIIAKVADTQSTILITGESGTGKELIARAVHNYSPKKNSPFVTVCCNAIPENLLESELFGHTKGAFSGAINNKKGLFEIADGGTFFLDEVAGTPHPVQVKLLRVLQEREFRRLGGTEDIKIDVRLIAATNRPLDQAVQKGEFREDLYYRLNVIPINLPPLRERKDDIAELAGRFLDKFNKIRKEPLKGISPRAMEYLHKYDWPGNVRELENIIERAVVLESGKELTSKSLPANMAGIDSQTYQNDIFEIPDNGIDFEQVLNDIGKKLFLEALDKTQWNKTNAAKLLNLSFRSFRYRLLKYQIEKS